jgi:hypothetical protein
MLNSDKFRALLKGIAKKLIQHRKYAAQTGGTNDSRYCYSVWLRHLVFNEASGIRNFKGTVAELGPGDSIGIGLAALLTGFENYYALDVYKYWDAEKNLKIFDELVTLFKKREPVPNDSEFPRVTPGLEDYSFPHHILTPELLDRTLAPERIERIRRELQQLDVQATENKMIHYFIPWNDESVMEAGSVDFIFSQAVLQYVDDLDETYHCMKRWLKPGAVMSHSIDFTSHGITQNWNGHWSFSSFEWKLAHGNNKIILNRAPYSQYVALNQKHNFGLVNCMDYIKESRITTKDLHKNFRSLTKEDLRTSVSVMISKKNMIISKLIFLSSSFESTLGLTLESGAVLI